MRKLFILGALCTTALVASPAFAEVPTGLRVEGLVGFDKLIKKDNVFTETAEGTYNFGRMFDTSLVYGGRVGYDFGFGGFALGVDGEVTNTSASDTKTLNIIATGDRRRFTYKGGLDLYAGVRATASLGDNIDAYVLGGYTNLHLKERLYDTTADPTAPVLLDARNHSRGGWRVGAGLHFGDGHWFGGPEYRYSHYGAGYTRSQFLLTAGYRFFTVAPPPPPPPPPPAPERGL